MLEAGTKVLGRYVVGETLWKSDATVTHHAKAEGMSKRVLLKVLRAGCTERQARRFERQARMMSQIIHPNVVPLDAFGLIEGKYPALVMQHFEGQTLAEHLASHGAMGWLPATKLMLSVLSGLEAVHATSVLHRNISPASILMLKGHTADSPKVKLLNLDLAIPMGGNQSQLSFSADFDEMVAYCSPEVLFDQDASPLSDIYSVAACLYHAVTGQKPLEVERLSQIRDALNRPLPQPQAPSGMPALPELFIATLMNAMERDPKRRTSSARGFAEDLRAAHRAAVRTQPHAPPKAPRPTSHCAVLVSQPKVARLSTDDIERFLTAELGERGWVRTVAGCVVTVVPSTSEERAERLALTMMTALGERFGDRVKSVWTPTRGFIMPDSIVAGELPAEIEDMIELVQI